MDVLLFMKIKNPKIYLISEQDAFEAEELLKQIELDEEMAPATIKMPNTLRSVCMNENNIPDDVA